MDLMLLGISLLLGYVIWRFAWKRTALDMYRDHLFDLRDEVKVFFVEKGYGTDHPLYEELRGLINGHIRYTENLSLRLFIAEGMALSKNPEMLKRLKEKIDKRFATDDEELAAFIKRVRRTSVAILNGYTVETSFGFLILMPFAYGLVGVIKGYVFLKAWAKNHNADRLICRARTAIRVAPFAGLLLAIPARAGLVNPEFGPSLVEEYSYQAAHR